jgi:hypothetical protein
VNVWNLVIPAVIGIIDKIIPDPKQAAEAKLRVMELEQRKELVELEAAVKIAAAQIDVNRTEAADPSLFKSGWRPAIGWVCAAGLGYQFLLRPFLPWLAGTFGLPVAALPALEMDTLMTLLFGILGLGAFRTAEKIKGAA